MCQRELEFGAKIATWSTPVNKPHFPQIISPGKVGCPCSSNRGDRGTVVALGEGGIVAWLEGVALLPWLMEEEEEKSLVEVELRPAEQLRRIGLAFPFYLFYA